MAIDTAIAAEPIKQHVAPPRVWGGSTYLK